MRSYNGIRDRTSNNVLEGPREQRRAKAGNEPAVVSGCYHYRAKNSPKMTFGQLLELHHFAGWNGGLSLQGLSPGSQ